MTIWLSTFLSLIYYPSMSLHINLNPSNRLNQQTMGQVKAQQPLVKPVKVGTLYTLILLCDPKSHFRVVLAECLDDF